MSKSALKKFRKNDYYDDEEFGDNPKFRANKTNEKRVERALRTKDIDALLANSEDEGIDPDDYEYMLEMELEDLMADNNANV